MADQYKRWWLYILRLEDGKYYVGITSKTPEVRLMEHKLGRRAAYWTKKYRPIDVEVFEDLGIVSREHAEKYENKITRSLMKERGLNNVRGGDLSEAEDYAFRFGRIWLKRDWEILTIAACSVSINVYFIIDKLFFSN